MFSGMSYTWMFALVTIGCVVLLVWRLVGPRRAVGCGMMLSLLVPEWVRWEPVLDVVWFNVTVSVAAWSLILYLCHPLSTYNFKLNWCDYAGIGMVATHIISDSFNSGPGAVVLLRAYGEWMLPYLAGRVAIQEVGDARWLLPCAVGVTLILATFGLLEMFIPGTNANIFEQLVQQQRGDEIRTPYDMHRTLGPIDLQRAYGPTHHPMYFGVLMFMLFPWMVYADSRAAKKKAPWWWRAMPYVCFVGVVSSISRAPILAVPLAIYLMYLILKPNWRPVLLGAGVVGIIALFLTWDKIQYAMESIAREQNSDRMVKIHGKEFRFTGTSHRWLMFVAYGPALQRTGPLGFGTARCAHFPPDVPENKGIPVEMFSVDNAFLLYSLRFGLLGFLCFSAMGIAAQWGYLKFALQPNVEGGVWLAAMASTLAAMAFVLFTVWLPQDFGFFYLFCIGASAGLWAEHDAPCIAALELRNQERSDRKGRRRRRHSRSPEESAEESAEELDTTPEEPVVEEQQPSSRRRSRRSRTNE